MPSQNFAAQTCGILDLTHSQMRTLLLNVPNGELAVFVAAADPDVARKICSSLSKRAAGYLCDDAMTVIGKIPEEDIGIAIEYILALAAYARNQAA